jgi:IPT/TIG domain
MWKLLLIALLLSAFSPAAAAQSAALTETLCTADSTAIAPINDNLQEGSHTVTLSWTASSNTLWYSVYRGTANGGPYALVANCVSGTLYVDVVAPSQTLYYVVTANNASGTSNYSNQAVAPIPLFDTLAAASADGISVQIGETLATSDALVPTSVQTITLAETLFTSDALAAGHAHPTSLNETLSTSDSLAPSAAFKVTLGESLNTADSLSSNYRATVSLGEFLTTADALNISFTGGASLAETLSTTDAISPTTTAHGATLGESLGTSDAFSLAGSFQLSLGESLRTLDALTLTVALPGTLSNGTAIYSLASYGIAPAGACGFTLQITGKGFTSNSVVTWNGSIRAVTYVSPTVMQVTLTNGDLAAPGEYPVIVWQGSYATSAKYFQVALATPMIAGARLAGGALIVDGRNFVPGYGASPGIVSAGTTVFWNGQPLATTWISYTRLQAQPPQKFGAIGNIAISVADAGCFAY